MFQFLLEKLINLKVRNNFPNECNFNRIVGQQKGKFGNKNCSVSKKNNNLSKIYGVAVFYCNTN